MDTPGFQHLDLIKVNALDNGSLFSRATGYFFFFNRSGSMDDPPTIGYALRLVGPPYLHKFFGELGIVIKLEVATYSTG